MSRLSEHPITPTMVKFFQDYKRTVLNPARQGLDVLPYTEQFDKLYQQFVRKFGETTKNGLWRMIVRVRKAGGFKELS